DVHRAARLARQAPRCRSSGRARGLAGWYHRIRTGPRCCRPRVCGRPAGAARGDRPEWLCLRLPRTGVAVQARGPPLRNQAGDGGSAHLGPVGGWPTHPACADGRRRVAHTTGQLLLALAVAVACVALTILFVVRVVALL